MIRPMFASIALAVVAGWLVTNRTGAQQDAEHAQAAKIQELRQLRHDVLQRYEVIKRNHEEGILQYDHVFAARDDLLKARLELAASKQERLDVCKQRVDNLRSLEELVELSVKTGDGPIEKKMLATAARLQAEIECLREEM